MSGVLLSVHVVAAILFIGPVTVAASMFPRRARVALTAEPGQRDGAAAVTRVLNRISRVYAAFGVAVPVFGVATGARMGVLGQTWLIVSMALTAAAALILIVLVLPQQEAALQLIDGGAPLTRPVRGELGRLGGFTGTFALIWVVVVILMIMRPGSTTGVH